RKADDPRTRVIVIGERPSCELELDVAQSVGIQNVTRNLPTAEARAVRDARVFRVGEGESVLHDQREQIRESHDHIENHGIHFSASSAVTRGEYPNSTVWRTVSQNLCSR